MAIARVVGDDMLTSFQEATIVMMSVGGSMAQNGGTEAVKLNELDTSQLYVCVEFQGNMMIARKKDIVWAKKAPKL